MRLALVRHGQTKWNLDALLQGSSDIPLNDTGRAQALEAAQLLSDESWDLVVSSPMQRARETAEVIAQTLQVPLGEADPSLVERAYGEAEGLTKEQAYERFGALWPGTESFAHLTARAVAAINTLAERHRGKNLVIVTHGTFIRAFADAMTGLATQTPDNAHSVRWEGEPPTWRATAGLILKEDT